MKKKPKSQAPAKRGRGRPAIHGDRKQVNLRLDVQLVGLIEAAAAERGVARDTWIAEACQAALLRQAAAGVGQ